MPLKPSALALVLTLLLLGGVAWPMGQRMDIFVPVDALLAEKPPRYVEAIDMLRALLISAPARTGAIKDRIAATQLLQANAEIDLQRYNEALATLSLFWAQNPERADQAQKLIRKINLKREEYNKKAKDLLAYMGNAANRGDPNYNREVTRRLEDLDALDRNNPDSKKTITSLKETSLALVNQDTMRSLMSAGRAFIDAGKYTAAAREYLKGFPLFKPEFENAGYDELTAQAVANEASRVEALPAEYEAAQPGIAKAVAGLVAAFDAGAPERVQAALPAAQQALDQLRGFRETAFGAGLSLSKSFDSIPKEGKSPVEYQYLAFLEIFIRGRPDSFGPDKKPEAEKGLPEGIGGALLAQTAALLDPLEKSAQVGADAAYAEAERLYDAGSYAEAQSAFARAAALALPAAQVISNWTLISETDFVPKLADLSAKIARGAAESARLTQLGSLASAGERLSGFDLAYLAAETEARAYVAGLDSSRALGDAQAALAGYRSAILGVQAKIEAERAAASTLADDRLKVALAAYATRLDKAADAAKGSEYAVAAALRVVEGDYVERELAARAAAVEAARSLVDAAAPNAPDGAASGYKDPSPTGAMRALDAELPQLAALALWITEELASMAAESGELAAYPPFAAARARMDELGTRTKELQFHRAAARVAVEGDYIERELAARTKAADASQALIDGLPSQRPERLGLVDPSPTSAIRELQAEAPKAAALAGLVTGYLASIATDPAALAADPPFAAASARVRDLGRRIDELRSRIAASLAKAADKKKAGEAALTGARQDYEAARLRLVDAKSLIVLDKGKGARSAAIRKNLADSRDRLDRSLTGVIESSNQDFDLITWDSFQKSYSALSADLVQTKKDYIINETFRLLGEGQTYYEQALFDLAAESLNGAQELWREDNVADQEQVKYWQNLVRQASDTNNKREVRQGDTLYYEIGSYLSEARKLYLKGDGLMKSGKKTDAGTAFEAARQNISYVTRAFPLNAEAGLLTLQILKSTDPEAYKKSLPRRVQEAVDLLATDASSGYSRLADLYKMEPAYSGLKTALERAEIKVGKRRAPPTRQELASAATLVAEAEKLLKTGRKDDATKAESNINAALTFDPANKGALALLRDLKTLQGKTAGPALGLADQALLDRATRSFASQAYNQARDQLSQLLADPAKRTREVLKLDNDLKTLGY